jgi:hypothetical protein
LLFQIGVASDNCSIGLAVGRLNVMHHIGQNASGVMNVVYRSAASYLNLQAGVRVAKGGVGFFIAAKVRRTRTNSTTTSLGPEGQLPYFSTFVRLNVAV